jgi:3-oxoacyl-[acyl-carrier protein] reductase
MESLRGPRYMDLEGDRALVTAASKGLGRAAAKHLLLGGASVAISSRSEANLADAKEHLVDEADVPDERVATVTCDLTDASDIEAAVEATVDAFGGLDVLVTNHGGPPQRSFEESTVEDLDGAYESVLRSTYLAVDAALPHLLDGDGGSITNIVSASARESPANHIVSNALRPGIYGLSKGLANEYGDEGLRANCVCPRAVMTERIERLNEVEAERDGLTIEEVQERRVEELPMKRPGDTDEFGRTVAFLASDDASFVTGAFLPVDGGWTRSAF